MKRSHNITRKTFPLLLFFCCILLSANRVQAQQMCFAYCGEWSPWQTICGEWSPWHIYGQSFRYNDGSGFELKNSGGTVFFSFKISNYFTPSKASIKAHKKSREWYEYSGYVEYYVSDEYPTAEALAKNNILVIPNARADERPKVKRRAYATIKIAPYEKNPYCYNLFFDNIGIGFSVQGLKYGDYKI